MRQASDDGVTNTPETEYQKAVLEAVDGLRTRFGPGHMLMVFASEDNKKGRFAASALQQMEGNALFLASSLCWMHEKVFSILKKALDEHPELGMLIASGMANQLRKELRIGMGPDEAGLDAKGRMSVDGEGRLREGGP